jgi:hypothetical protein
VPAPLPFAIRPAAPGLGAFARRDLRAGEVVYRIPAGRFRLISYRQLLRKRVTDNPVQISPRRYLDWGGPALRLNHACAPNVGLTSYPNLGFVALRAIAAGEELRWDYSTSMDRETVCDFACTCGAKTCRGSIRGFNRLPARLRSRYLKAGVVQDFLKHER